MSVSELLISIATKVKEIKEKTTLALSKITEKGGTYSGTGMNAVLDGIDSIKSRVTISIGTLIVKDEDIIDGVWANNSVRVIGLRSDSASAGALVFEKCTLLKKLDANDWDVSGFPVFRAIFNNCTSLEELNISNWDTSNVTRLWSTFSNCSSLKSLDINSWNTSSLTRMDSTFSASAIEHLDISNWDVKNLTTMDNVFRGFGGISINMRNWNTSSLTNVSYLFYLSNVKSVDITGWDAHNLTTVTGFSAQNYKLETLIGYTTIDDVKVNNIATMIGLKVSMELHQIPLLDRASMRALINGLADLTGQTAQTLKFHANAKARLTEEDIAIATVKNWSIS